MINAGWYNAIVAPGNEKNIVISEKPIRGPISPNVSVPPSKATNISVAVKLPNAAANGIIRKYRHMQR